MTRLGLITISALVCIGISLLFGVPGVAFIAGAIVGLVGGALLAVFVVVTKR